MAVALAGPLFLLTLARAQTTDSSLPTLHAETRVVQIDVVVVDSHGKPVAGLTKQDFAVTDERKARSIDIFSIVSHTDRAGEAISVDAAYVKEKVAPLAEKGDLSRFIL